MISSDLWHGDAERCLDRIFDRRKGEPYIDSLVTSPPYFLKRQYMTAGPDVSLEIGSTADLSDYLNRLRRVFRRAFALLKNTGTVFVNIGDTFDNGRSLRIPNAFVDMVVSSGFTFIQEVVWAKSITTPMGNQGSCKPESTKRRFTSSHEYVLFFSKDPRGAYHFDPDAVSVPLSASRGGKDLSILDAVKSMGADSSGNYKGKGQKDYEQHRAEDASALKNRILRNRLRTGNLTARRRSVWQIPTSNSVAKHTAIGPLDLFRTCVKAGSPTGGIILDPFMGLGTTGHAAILEQRNFIGIDLHPDSFAATTQRLLGLPNSDLTLNRISQG